MTLSSFYTSAVPHLTRQLLCNLVITTCFKNCTAVKGYELGGLVLSLVQCHVRNCRGRELRGCALIPAYSQPQPRGLDLESFACNLRHAITYRL